MVKMSVCGIGLFQHTLHQPANKHGQVALRTHLALQAVLEQHGDDLLGLVLLHQHHVQTARRGQQFLNSKNTERRTKWHTHFENAPDQ
mgnify:CR=1 FL=1